MVFLLVLSFTVMAIAVTWYLGLRRYRTVSQSPLVSKPAYQFQVEKLNTPAGVYFSPTHSWAHLQSSGQARIGIDGFIQGLTGVLSTVTLPEMGQTIAQGEPMIVLEHRGKHLTLSAPVSGTITALNVEALQNLRLVHRDPYGHGWLCEIQPTNWEADTKHLYLGNRTSAWLKHEITRIRDFFAHSFAPPASAEGLVVLQEGGEIAEGALAFAGKGLWGSFQKLIIDEANQDLISKS